jgi:hypothetical protein
LILLYSFFSASQLLLPVFQSPFQFTVISLHWTRKAFPALLLLSDRT